MRIPKLRGFKNRFKIEYEVVNIGAIGALAEAGAFELEGDAKKASKSAPITVNQDILRAVGLVRTLNKPMKILGAGEVSTPLFVVADAFTASARAKIEAAGGSVNVLEVPKTPLAALGVTPTRGRRDAAPQPWPRSPSPTKPAKAPKASKPKAAGHAPPTEAETDRRPDRDRRRRRGDAAGHRRRRRRRADHGRRGRAGVRRRRLTRVRIAPQRLPRAGHPAPDPVCPRAADRLPPAGVGADPGRRQGRSCRSSSRAARWPACSTCSRAAACRISRSSRWG